LEPTPNNSAQKYQNKAFVGDNCNPFGLQRFPIITLCIYQMFYSQRQQTNLCLLKSFLQTKATSRIMGKGKKKFTRTFQELAQVSS